MEINYSFENDDSISCRIAEGWDEAGREGQYFGVFSCGSQWWAIVQWDDEEDPNFHKKEGIEVSRTTWMALKHE